MSDQIQKMGPTGGDLHVSQPLTNISIAYKQGESSFIADKVFPNVPVAKQYDQFYTYDKGDFMRDEAQLRGNAAESAGGEFALGTDDYRCKVWAFHKDIGDQDRANADSVLQLDSAATEFVTHKLLLRKERDWASKFFGTGIWGTDDTDATKWDAAGARPRKIVDEHKQTIKRTTGLEANTLVITDALFYALRDAEAIRDQFKYTSADSIDEAMLARYFGVQRLFRLNTVYNAAKKGAAADMQYIMGTDSALLCYAAPAPSLMLPSAGYTFVWTGFVGAQQGWRMKRLRADLLGADRIEGELAMDHKMVAADCGVFLNDLLT